MEKRQIILIFRSQILTIFPVGTKRLGIVRGGGLQKLPVLTRLPDIVAKKGKKGLIARPKFFRNYLDHFSQVKIEVTRGHQSSNFPKISVFHQKIANISKTIIDRTDLQKAPDSLGRAQVTFFFRQIWVEVNGLDSRAQSYQCRTYGKI